MDTGTHLRLVNAPTGQNGGDSDIAALRAGDTETIERVIEGLLPKVRSWLHRLLGPDSDLDDAVQDALVEITRALPRFEGRASISTLAHKITVRVAYRYFGKRKKRRSESPLETAAESEPIDALNPEDRASDRQQLARLYRVLDKLPKKRRTAFLLCAVEGLSPTEAAKLEGVSAVAMRSRLMHARSEVLRRLPNEYLTHASSATSTTIIGVES